MSMSNAIEVNVPISKLAPEQHKCYERVQTLKEFYSAQFGAAPEFIVRVPGRVNLIGEHVDYCGFPVLPMAVEQCILLAVGSSKDNQLLELKNIEASKFDSFNCDLKAISIDIPKTGGPAWYNYYLCGVRGIFDTLGEAANKIGMKVALSGNIPPASGLSSSSALVSASVLATARVHGLPLNRKELASVSAKCERYIGTESGGMDQAIAYLGEPGKAQLIEFHPKLNATPVCLPPGLCFVVASSLVLANKAAFSDYNERVVECRLSARWLAKCSGLANWREIRRLVQVQEALNCNFEALEQLVEKHLPQEIYTREEACNMMEVPEQQFEQEYLTTNTTFMQKFKLRQRTLHVVQECLRVQKFRAVCEQAQSQQDDAGKSGVLRQLSQLIRASHRSLKELYECSHPNLDRLVEISDEAGVGARLCGAGWGGCIIALCESVETSTGYIKALKEQYFMQLPAETRERYRANDFSEVVFVTCPGKGAEIYNL